jgi:hypothetical protein
MQVWANETDSENWVISLRARLRKNEGAVGNPVRQGVGEVHFSPVFIR